VRAVRAVRPGDGDLTHARHRVRAAATAGPAHGRRCGLCRSAALKQEITALYTWQTMIPPPPPPGTRIGFSTYAMWGLCIALVGACYIYEEREKTLATTTRTLPTDVRSVLPSGAWLMKDGSIRRPEEAR